MTISNLLTKLTLTLAALIPAVSYATAAHGEPKEPEHTPGARDCASDCKSPEYSSREGGMVAGDRAELERAKLARAEVARDSAQRPLGTDEAALTRVLPRDGGSSTAGCSAECQASYVRAFWLLADDRPAEAAATLRVTLVEIGDPYLLHSATTLLDLAEARQGRMIEQRSLTASGIEGAGRFPFVAWTTLACVTGGVLIGSVLDIPDARSNVLMVMAVTGAGFGASLLSSRHAVIDPETASFYGAGLLSGGLMAWHTAGVLELSGQATSAGIILGTAAGGGAGYLLGRSLSASAGSPAALLSGLGWGTAVGFLLIPAIQPDKGSTRSGIRLAGSVGGLSLGSWMAFRTRMSRTRVLMVDLGALVGGLAMGGLGIAILDGSPAALVPRVVPAMTVFGIVAGGGLALLLSREWDEGRRASEETPRALLHFEGGKMRAGSGAPFILHDPSGRGTILGLGLVSGTL